MGLFDKFKNSMDDVKKMQDNAKKASGIVTDQNVDINKPVDMTEPMWEPILGISMDKYVELTVHMAKNSIFITDKVNAYVESHGVPEGKWPDVMKGWSTRIGEYIEVRTRYGAIYNKLFSQS